MKYFLCFLLLIPITNTFGQLYKDSTQSVDVRVKDLLSRMTPEEKFWQVFMIPSDGDTTNEKLKHGIFGLQISAGSGGDAGGQLLNYNTTENATILAKKVNRLQAYFVTQTRLGIPIIPFDEALHGLVRHGATAFPQAIGLAATWDTTLIHQVATQIALECKMRGIRQILSPVVNLATDVRWGRTEETYGEDPFLTSEIGLAFIRSFEQQGIITTPKHFIANVGDGGRDSYPIHLSEWYLEQSHLIPFKRIIREGGARSIMTAYNSLNGTACSSNDWLLNQKLKKQWGFKGFVISDANAVGGEVVLHNTASSYAESGAHAINGGLDVIFQTDYNHAALFYPAFQSGLVDSNRLNDAVSRVLRAKFELGLFEKPYITIPKSSNSISSQGKKLSQQAAEKSFVLLKNKNQVLPLNPSVHKIALFGMDASQPRLGGYSGPGNNPLSILDGLKAIAGDSIQITYQETVSYSDTLFTPIYDKYLENETGNGLIGLYFDNVNFTGNPVLSRTDSQIDFNWTLYGPSNELENHFYSVKWTGNLIAPESGKIDIGLEGNDGYRLYLNDKIVIDRWEKTSYHQDLIPIDFVKGKKYPIRIEFKEPKGNGKIRLIWNYSINSSFDSELKKAIKATKKADVAVIVVGIHEGEFQDRASLRLPGNQERLIQELHKTGKPMIVLLVGGSAITMDEWISDADAIVSLWYPGEAGGLAVANLLTGKINPAGRLPITFPISEAQLPLTYNHLPTGRSDDYYNLSGEPLFPFGYGLSYTQFSYSDLKLAENNITKDESVDLSFKLTNTGKRAGEEVVQLYIKSKGSAQAQPIIALKGFQRISLNSKESKIIHFTLNPQLFTHISPDLKEIIESGNYELLIGSSSRDLQLKAVLTIQ
ncbi:beta-glucosidase [Fluviicola taffensis]|uniref:Beta-glucosidase n=1 Tax=Fluviicola taffensis (strain DSM 16823 / NCIMB 13979 / RW262) TaxID=755732 RepID=F2IIT6_FLUTR|nr:beta-glucosidase [Fluviicola taffensis]AEA42793.1 Beta-glucosidase [Fluviicola taffensis DSM 16823]